MASCVCRSNEPEHAALRGNVCVDKLHPSVNTGRAPQFDANRFGFEQALTFVRCAGARMAMDDCGLYGKRLPIQPSGARTGRIFPAERFMDHLDHCKRGLKSCR